MLPCVSLFNHQQIFSTVSGIFPEQCITKQKGETEKMKWYSILASVCAVVCLISSQAQALQINNRVKPDGTPVLIPEVQKYEAQPGVLAIPAEVTVAAPESAANEVDVFASLIKRYFPGRAVKNVKGDAFLRLELTKKNVPASEEGYNLAICSKKGILIRSRSVKGLYYGIRTVGNLLRNAEKPEIPCCRISDWPLLSIRGLYLNLRHQGAEDIDELLSEIDTIGAMKYNHAMLEFGENFPYKNNPFTKRRKAFTMENIEAIKAAAKRNHIEIVPVLQILSHDVWLQAHPRYKAEMAEGKPIKPWSSSSCPLSPVVREVQMMAINEQIDAFQPKFFNLSMDEIAQCPWGVCPRCRKEDPKKLWQDATVLYTNAVLARNVRPILYHDMYYAGTPVGGDELLPKLDKRVIFCNWDYGTSLKVSRFDFFKRAGFRLFSMSYCLRMDNMRVMPLEMYKRGNDGIFLSFWGEFRFPSDPRMVSGRGLAGFTLGGYYAWNPKSPAVSALGFDAAWESLRMVLPEVAPYAPADTKFKAVPLDKAFNTKLGKDPRFPKTNAAVAAQMKREVGGTRENFHVATSEDGGYYAVVTNGGVKPVKIAVNAKAPWLGTVVTAGSMTAEPGGRPYAAVLLVRYADNTVEHFKFHYRSTLPFWNYDGGGYGVRCITRFNDVRGALVGLHARNWRNPHPDKLIREIEFFTPAKSRVPVALLALSLGDADRKIAAPDDKAAAASVKAWSEPARFQPINAKTAGSMKILNYDGGKLKRAKVYLSGKPDDKKMGGSVLSGDAVEAPQSCFEGKMRYSVAVDPQNPGRGKVLKISIPALKKQYSHLRCRLVLDLSFDRSKIGDINTFYFDYRLSHPEFHEWPAVYLMNSKPFGAAVYAGYLEGRRDRNWHHLAIPVRLFKNERRKLNLAKADTVRVSFFLRELTEPSTVYLGDLGISPKNTSLLTPLRAEKVPTRPGEKPGELFFID